MTWDFAYEIKVHEVNGGDVCVSMLVKDAYLDSVNRTLESLGYQKCRTAKEHIGIIETYELEDDKIWTVTAE